MQKTSIEYLTHTWNPIAMRCTRISDGCHSCWHLTLADRLAQNPVLNVNERLVLAGQRPFILRERELFAPLHKKKAAVIGVQFMGDLFHETVPDEFRVDAYSVMLGCDRHTYLILTKRPQEMLRYFRTNTLPGYVGRNHIYHGLTVCNQREADEKIPLFLQVPGKKFLSIEPMLGAIDLGNIDYVGMVQINALTGSNRCQTGGSWSNGSKEKVDAVLLGGETGPGARPMHPDWVRSVRDQCQAAGIPFFLKSMGKGLGRTLDGHTHDYLPWRE